MSFKKQYFKTKSYCRVTFHLDKAMASGAGKVGLAADFNDWQPARTPMKALKDGDFKVSVDLEKGREYQYRFVLDGGIWITDEDADKYVHCDYANSRNSVIVV